MNPTRSFSSFPRLLVTAACLAALAGCQTAPEITGAAGFVAPKPAKTAPVVDLGESNGPPQAGGGYY